MSSRKRCAACGHTEADHGGAPMGARVGDDWLCHEDDHSCYAPARLAMPTVGSSIPTARSFTPNTYTYLLSELPAPRTYQVEWTDGDLEFSVEMRGTHAYLHCTDTVSQVGVFAELELPATAGQDRTQR